MNIEIKAAFNIGSQVSEIVVDGVTVGYFTSNYDFSGRGSFAAKLGPKYWETERLGTTSNRQEAIDMVLKAAGKK